MPSEGITKDENSLDSRFYGNDKAFTSFVIPAEAGIQGVYLRVQLLRSQSYLFSFIFWICSPC